MPTPDMVFTPAEVYDADRAHGVAPIGGRPGGPDMVFTPAEVATANAPAPDMVFTTEEVDAYNRAHGAGHHEAHHAGHHGGHHGGHHAGHHGGGHGGHHHAQPAPDMVFTPAEVYDADRAAGIPTTEPRPGGPDMVITPAEVEAYDRAHGAGHHETHHASHHGGHHGTGHHGGHHGTGHHGTGHHGGHHHSHPRAPDMVFTPEEVAAADAAAATGAAAQPAPTAAPASPAGAAAPAITPERADAIAQAGASRQSEVVNTAGAVNDTLSAVNAARPISDRVTGPIGTIAGLGQMYNSWTQGNRPGASHEDRVQAAFGMGIGGLGAAGGVATTAGLSGLSGVLGVASGVLESVQGGRNLASHDVAVQGQGGQQLAHGLLSGGAGLATLAGSPLALPLAAGAAGVSIGTTMQQRADAVSLEQGRYTEQRAGRGVNGGTTTHNISATDAAVRSGMEDGELTRQALMDLTGNRTISNAAGYASGFINTGVHSIYNTLTNLW